VRSVGERKHREKNLVSIFRYFDIIIIIKTITYSIISRMYVLCNHNIRIDMFNTKTIVYSFHIENANETNLKNIVSTHTKPINMSIAQEIKTYSLGYGTAWVVNGSVKPELLWRAIRSPDLVPAYYM